MIVINFYRKYATNWEKLQTRALEVIDNFNEKIQELDNGEVETHQQYNDYREAVKMGLQTFIFQVVNEWDFQELLILNGQFYKKFDTIEIDGYFRKTGYTSKVYKEQNDLFKIFNLENIKISSEEFDEIVDTFESDVVTKAYSFEYEIREINEDGDWLDENGFGNIFE